VTAANINDLQVLDELLGAQVVPTPDSAMAEARHLCLDGAYKYARGYQIGEERRFTLHFQPKPGSQPPVQDGAERHPARRWVVERSHSWMNRFRRLLIRWEKKLTNYTGFAQLAICLIICRKLRIRAAQALSG
jgi:putative transposase